MVEAQLLVYSVAVMDSAMPDGSFRMGHEKISDWAAGSR
ncbi:hypothetical protein SYN60AY4M2_05785 [Synechococcus sp. 60AY4M2]|nr:hypothetical protein SYN65AY6A5_09040 [Synechococcus sp. 65AY6A5]PIK96424.1 hypothetical protein SYN60AY4M2_05785 [Synechococcus sp. 60AY4M2]PIK99021.1 hypothetical protein SYN63AY4M1_03240 [Synechococcus sp. 63AY4M1]PIL02532.1 hypothetical protein SYN65AY640_10865 [Synechococcus sp. 65AY640]